MGFTLDWTPPKITTTQSAVAYEEGYAPLIHEGWARKDGSEAPARRWVDAGVDEFDFIEWFFFSYATEGENLSSAFRAMMWQFYDHLHEIMLEPRWNWDRATKREDGSIVTSPRDIYDTGQLYESQTLTFDQGGDGDERDA
ncbi:MAG: hypothetical protein F6K65_37455 [Moorea sp. SIO3C2]|nr:hypothetical protein [Moorena sp. SIO3C2]